MQKEEIAKGDAGPADLDTEEGTVVVQENRIGTGGHAQALFAKARAQVGVRRNLHARPFVAAVELERDVVHGQLHEPPVEVQSHGPEGLHGVHARNDSAGIDRFGRLEGGERDVDVLQVDQRIVVVPDLDGHVGRTKQDGIDRQIFQAAVVGRQVALALELAQARVQPDRAAGQATGQLGVDVQCHAAALLESEIAFDIEEATDAQQGIVECHPDQRPVVIENEVRTAHAERQRTTVVAAGEIDERTSAGHAAPVPALVERDLQALQLELEQRPVDFQRGVPVHLQRIQVGHHIVGIGQQRRIHEHQTEVDVVQRDAPTVVVQTFTGVEQPIAVGVDEVRPQAHKNVHIGGRQEGGGRLQTLDAAIVVGDTIDLVQAALERCVVADLAGAQPRADIDQGRCGLLEIETAADVDVIRDGQGGAIDPHPQNLTACRIRAHLHGLSRARRHGGVVQRHHPEGAAGHAVHLQRNALRRQGETIDAQESHAVGGGRQGHPGRTDSIRAVEQHQTQIDPGQLQAQSVLAVAIDARKGTTVRDANGQHAAVHGAAIGHGDAGIRLRDAEIARDLQEAKNVDDQPARQLRELAVGAVHLQHQAGFGSGEDLQFGVARIGRIRAVCCQAVVHHRAVRRLAVDLQGQCVDFDRQAVDAVEAGAVDGRLRAGPAARRDRRLARRRCRHLFGHERQTQAHAREVQAHVARAHEGAQVAAANEQHVHVHQGFVLWRERVVFHPGQAHLALFALDAEVAFDRHETKQVQRQAAGQARELSVSAVHLQHQAGFGSGEDLQLGVARIGRIRAVCCQAVVHHRAVRRLAVDLQGQRVDFDRQAFDPFEAGAVDGRLRAGPAARGLGRLARRRCRHLFGHERQTQAHAREVQAHVARAHEGAQVAAANEQHVHVHQGFVLWRERVVFHPGQAHLALFALDAEVAFDRHETKQVQRQAAGQARELSIGAVHAQFNRRVAAARSSGNGQGLGGKVHQDAVGRRTVDLQVQVGAAQAQPFHPDHRDTVGAGLRRGPLARLGARRLQARQAFGHDGVAEIHTAQRQAGGAIGQFVAVVVGTARADEGPQVAAPEGQRIHGELAGGTGHKAFAVALLVGQGHLLLAELDGQFAFDQGETVQVNFQVASGFGHFTFRAVQAEGEAISAVSHRQFGRTVAVVHHQGALRLGWGDVGVPQFDRGQRHVETGCGFFNHQGSDIRACKAAAKGHLPFATVVELQFGAGAGHALQGLIEAGLHVGLRHAGVQFTGGDGLTRVGQRHGVGHVAVGRVELHALHLAAGRTALSDVAGLDEGQAQVAIRVGAAAEMAAQVGHVGQGQITHHGQQEGGAVVGTLAGVLGHLHVAGPQQRVHGGLHIRQQHSGLLVVRNRRAVHPLAVAQQRQLEIALGQGAVGRQALHLQGLDGLARQITGKADAVSVGAVGRDVDGAQIAQAAVVAGHRCTQRGLNVGRRSPQGQGGGLVGLPPVLQAQGPCAGGVPIAVNGQALHGGHGGSAVGQQARIQVGADHAHATVGDVGGRQCADEAHQIALGAHRATVELHGNIADIGVQQFGVGRADVAEVLCGVAHHKGARHAACQAAAAVGLQGHGLQILAGQRAAHRQVEGVGIGRPVGPLDHLKPGPGDDAKSALHRRLDGGCLGIPGDQPGLVGGACVCQAQAVAMGQGVVAQHHPLLLLLGGNARVHAAQFGAGVHQG